MKLYILTGSKTVFVYSLKHYTGKYKSIKNTFLTFVKNFEDKNKKLYVDIYYNIYDLADILKKKIYLFSRFNENK